MDRYIKKRNKGTHNKNPSKRVSDEANARINQMQNSFVVAGNKEPIRDSEDIVDSINDVSNKISELTEETKQQSNRRRSDELRNNAIQSARMEQLSDKLSQEASDIANTAQRETGEVGNKLIELTKSAFVDKDSIKEVDEEILETNKEMSETLDSIDETLKASERDNFDELERIRESNRKKVSFSSASTVLGGGEGKPSGGDGFMSELAGNAIGGWLGSRGLKGILSSGAAGAGAATVGRALLSNASKFAVPVASGALVGLSAANASHRLSNVDEDLKSGKITDSEASKKKTMIATETAGEVLGGVGGNIAGIAGGKLAGKLIGGRLGTVAGSIGGPLGAAAGMIIGDLVGGAIGEAIGGYLDDNTKAIKENTNSVEDSSKRPILVNGVIPAEADTTNPIATRPTYGMGRKMTPPGVMKVAPSNKSDPTGRQDAAMKFFMDSGYSPEHAAAIVGNLMTESGAGLNEKAGYENGIEKSYGIAQWNSKGSPERYANFKQRYGKELTDSTFEEQLDFIKYELMNGENSAYRAMMKTNTAAEAAAVFDSRFERSSGEHRSKRMANAENLVARAREIKSGNYEPVKSNKDLAIEGNRDKLNKAEESKANKNMETQAALVSNSVSAPVSNNSNTVIYNNDTKDPTIRKMNSFKNFDKF